MEWPGPGFAGDTFRARPRASRPWPAQRTTPPQPASTPRARSTTRGSIFATINTTAFGSLLLLIGLSLTLTSLCNAARPLRARRLGPDRGRAAKAAGARRTFFPLRLPSSPTRISCPPTPQPASRAAHPWAITLVLARSPLVSFACINDALDVPRQTRRLDVVGAFITRFVPRRSADVPRLPAAARQRVASAPCLTRASRRMDSRSCSRAS